MKKIAALLIVILSAGCSSTPMFSGVLTTERGRNLCTVHFWNQDNGSIEVAEEYEFSFLINTTDGVFLH